MECQRVRHDLETEQQQLSLNNTNCFLLSLPRSSLISDMNLGEILSHYCFKYFFCFFPFLIFWYSHTFFPLFSLYLGYSFWGCPMVLESKKDVLFIIEDWNTKVRSQEIPGVTGKFGLGVQNEAGQRLTRVLPRECTGHSKHPLPTTQEKTLHMDTTRWPTLKSDWLYSL